jgi:hypothetical protein
MHFKSLLHVRDHAKVRGTAHHLLEYIALHVNMHTGEAFELTVERLAHRLEVTPQWVGRLLNRLIASGELSVQRSRGRHPNVYRIPYERCHVCQGDNPKLEFGVHRDRDHVNPKLPAFQPQTEGPATPNSLGHNPKLRRRSTAHLTRIEPSKDVKDLKERKESATPNFEIQGLDKPERQSRWWCEAHGFCHSERLPDHRADCVQEREVDDYP